MNLDPLSEKPGNLERPAAWFWVLAVFFALILSLAGLVIFSGR